MVPLCLFFFGYSQVIPSMVRWGHWKVSKHVSAALSKCAEQVRLPDLTLSRMAISNLEPSVLFDSSSIPARSFNMSFPCFKAICSPSYRWHRVQPSSSGFVLIVSWAPDQSPRQELAFSGSLLLCIAKLLNRMKVVKLPWEIAARPGIPTAVTGLCFWLSAAPGLSRWSGFSPPISTARHWHLPIIQPVDASGFETIPSEIVFGKILWNYDLLWVRTKQLDSGMCWSQFRALPITTRIYVKILALSHGIFVGGACSPVSMVAEELERSVWEPRWVLSSDKSNHESISIETPHVSGTYV